MIQHEFAHKAKAILETDDKVVGLAVAGSWLTNELDEFSDLDLILVTKQKIAGNKCLMVNYAKKLGDFLSGFTGEHLGEPRVLICLYNNPLLHVDIKFLTLEEFHSRIETPAILIDKNRQLEKAISNSQAELPYPDYQWIEDRFWIWIHYALLKIGRGEFFEAYDFFGFLRMVVFGPLLHIKNHSLPRGVRKLEAVMTDEDANKLKTTMPEYNRQSLIESLKNAVTLYRQLSVLLFDDKVLLQKDTEQNVMTYFERIENSTL